MVVNFPVTDVNDPNYSHTHTEPSGVTWTWDGEKWRVTNNSSDGGGGAPSDINLQEVTDNGAITDNIIDFQSGAIVSGGQLQLPGGGNDTDALQRQEVVSLINSNQTVTDGRYLRLDVDAAAQSVESTAGVSYKGLTQHEAGIKVTGGDATSVDTGMCLSGVRPAIVKDGVLAAVFNPQGNGQFSVGNADRDKTLVGLQGISSLWSSDNHGNQAIDLFYGPITVDTNTSGTVNGVRIVPGTTQTGTGQFVGYRSVINNADVPNGEPYNFYAGGDAPNYFKGVTEHAGGVDVTAGNITLYNSSTKIRSKDTNNHITLYNLNQSQGMYFTASGVGNNTGESRGFFFSAETDADLGSRDFCSIQSRIQSNIQTTGDVKIFATKNDVQQNLSGNFIGYASNLNSNDNAGTGGIYNFYAQGNAPNFFAGSVSIYSAIVPSPAQPATNALYFQATQGSGDVEIRHSRASNSGSDRLYYQRWLRALTGAANNVIVGSIYSESPDNIIINVGPGGASNIQSDYRIKQNITPLSSAVDTIKALNPVTFNYTNGDTKTYQGFIAHELQEHIPRSVTGNKDEVEAIGTLLDWDGTEA